MLSTWMAYPVLRDAALKDAPKVSREAMILLRGTASELLSIPVRMRPKGLSTTTRLDSKIVWPPMRSGCTRAEHWAETLGLKLTPLTFIQPEMANHVCFTHVQ